jgi:hypothetical protein
MEQGQRIQYSDWLQAEWSGVQIPSEAIHVTLPKTVQWVQGFFLEGETAGHSNPSNVEIKNE